MCKLGGKVGIAKTKAAKPTRIVKKARKSKKGYKK